MPAVGEEGYRVKVKRPATRQPRTVRITSADQQDRARAARRPPSPDQQDRNRSPAQKVRDAAITARNVRVSRVNALRNAPSRRDALRALPGVTKGPNGRYRVTDMDAFLAAGGGKYIPRRSERSGVDKAAGEALAPVLKILEQTTRPSHGQVAALRQFKRDVDSGKGLSVSSLASAYGRGLKLEDKSTYSDVLKDVGVKNKYVAGAAGLTLDIATDPLTYVSFGVGGVATKAAEKAARKASADALKAGASKKAADKAGRAAAAKVLATETNRGLTVGFAGKQTSGRTTAKISRKLRIPQASDKARASLPGRLVRHVAPSVKPAGVDEKDFLRVRDAMVRGRAIASTGEKRVRNRAQAIARVLPGDKHPQITDALEGMGGKRLSAEERAEQIAALESFIRGATSKADRQAATGRYEFGIANEKNLRPMIQDAEGQLAALKHQRLTDPLAGLSGAERQVVAALRHDYDAMHAAEHSRGLVGPKFKEFGYSPRRPASELEPAGSRRRIGGAQLESSKARTNRRRYAEFRGSEDDIYTENAALAYYLRGRDSFVKQGRKEVIDALHDVGRRWHPGAALKDGEEIYRFSPRHMPVKVEGDELKSLMRGGAPPGLNEYRVLHRELVSAAEQGIPERVRGLEEIGRIWDRQIQGRVKTVLTVVNPQYHLTNLYGDLFNAYKAAPVVSVARGLGVSARALAFRARREAASKTLAKQVDPKGRGVMIGGQKVPLDQLLKEAEENGAINQGFIGRDLAEVLDRQGKEAAQAMGRGRVARRTGRVGKRIATSRVGSKVAHPIESVRGASQYREDAVRLALYLVRRRKGDTPAEAARYTNRHLLDYGDLTQFEKSVLRRVLPFYTWTARNTPQQIRALIERPGKYASLEKAREESQKTSDLPADYEGDLEKYEQQGAPFAIPGTSNLLYPKLPVTDLGRLTIKDQGNYLMAMLTPIIKNPVELDQNYSFFLRRKIDELVSEKGPEGQTVEQLKPAPPILLKAFEKMPGPIRRQIAESLHLTPYTDKRTGKRVIGWPAKIDYVWRSTPATTFAGQAGAQIPNTRGQSPGQATFGYLTGLKVVPYRPTEAAKKEAGEMYGYLQALSKSMRDRGTAYDKNGNRTAEYQKVLDQAREAYKVIDPNPPKNRSVLPPEAQEALKKLRSSVGGGLSPEAQAALQNLRKP